MTKMIFLPRSAIIGFCLVVTACGTPEEVKDLAGKTAANTAFVGTALRELSQNSRAVAELRAASIARLKAATIEVRSRVELHRALNNESGNSAVDSRVQQLNKWSAAVDKIFAAGEVDEKTLATGILATRTEHEDRSKALVKIAKILAELAKEDSFKDRAKFFSTYVRTVAKEVKTKREESKKSAGEAAKMLNKKNAN
jgi:hypothetical protein